MCVTSWLRQPKTRRDSLSFPSHQVNEHQHKATGPVSWKAVWASPELGVNQASAGDRGVAWSSQQANKNKRTRTWSAGVGREPMQGDIIWGEWGLLRMMWPVGLFSN